ncbi:MAG: nucleoside hydrolase [Anaerolineaceae bacterium]|nr:nucleoside hydrolase [Anaerolineaceae bacterium]
MSKKWTFLICAVSILSIAVGCVPAIEKSIVENTPPPVIDEIQEDAPPATPAHQTEEVVIEPLSAKIPLIFSHGGGPCDIGALVYLTKHPNVDLLGMVLSYGEIHPIEAVDDWPIFLYDVLDYDGAAVALGTEIPLDPNSHEFPSGWRNSADDFWGLDLPAKSSDYDTAVGHKLIIDLINNSPEKVTLLVMGAQTDIALALQEDPGIIDNISHIIIMGGAFNMRGNLDEGPEWTSNEAAEWNMYIDALAAKFVFNSGVPLSIIPLDAIQYYVQSEDINSINKINDPGVDYVAQMWSNQFGWAGGEFLIWDTITATAVTNPENFYWTYDGVDVITETGDFQGQTIALNNGAQHTRFATDADYAAVLNQIFETFRGETVLAPPANSEPDSNITELAGTWEGFNGDFHIIFTLESECELNEKCGTFEMPEISLSGDISFINIHDGVYEFKATNLSSGNPSEAEYEYLQLQKDGTLKYYSIGTHGTSEAILYKIN